MPVNSKSMYLAAINIVYKTTLIWCQIAYDTSEIAFNCKVYDGQSYHFPLQIKKKDRDNSRYPMIIDVISN